MDNSKALLEKAAKSIRELLKERDDLRISVIAFCAPWAVKYAKDHGLPAGHLASEHYDILERAGARMADFTRIDLKENK